MSFRFWKIMQKRRKVAAYISEFHQSVGLSNFTIITDIVYKCQNLFSGQHSTRKHGIIQIVKASFKYEELILPISAKVSTSALARTALHCRIFQKIFKSKWHVSIAKAHIVWDTLHTHSHRKIPPRQVFCSHIR